MAEDGWDQQPANPWLPQDDLDVTHIKDEPWRFPCPECGAPTITAFGGARRAICTCGQVVEFAIRKADPGGDD